MNAPIPENKARLNLEELYITVWKRMLNSILGWSEQEVLVWAAKYTEYLRDPDDIFYHEDPPYWAASALVPNQVDKVLSADQRSRLRSEILSVLPCKEHLISYLDVNWEQYKEKINMLITRYAV